MKRRLMIARALVHEPKLLILDEPTAGVDIEIRQTIWHFLRELNAQGTTIILTTHYLEEAEELCKNIAIINKGEILRNTPTHTLLRELSHQTLMLDLVSEPDTPPVHPDFTVSIKSPLLWEVTFSEHHTINELFEFLSLHHIEVHSFKPKANRLETLFLQLTKEEIS
jgi:ABC-2 type transport system ATP-binding protein